MTTHTPQKVPEHFSRVDIGAYMRELRLHYGLSEQDVSERLHIRVKYVTAIENAQFDMMPGKAYARGYVHTYAEFLGLDADQIVERCFGGEMAREVQEHSIPESSNWYKRNKAYGGVLAVLLLLGALFYFAAPSDPTPEDTETAEVTSGVESVPEEYLASMRNRLMPTAANYPCLGDETPLGCYYSQRLTKLWTTTTAVPNMAPVRVDELPEVEEEVTEIDVEEEEAAPKEEAPAPAPKKKEEAPKPAAKPAPKPAAKKETVDERTHIYRPPPPPGLQKAEEEAQAVRDAGLPDPNLAIPEEPVPMPEDINELTDPNEPLDLNEGDAE